MICVVDRPRSPRSGTALGDFWQLVPWLALVGRRMLGGVLATPRRGVRRRRADRQRRRGRSTCRGRRSRTIETRWALTLVTAYGRFTAWAAPSGGRGPARRACTVRAAILGRSIGASGPADPAAVVARRRRRCCAISSATRWEQLRAAGHLDDPVLEHARAPVRWHFETFAAGAGARCCSAIIGAIGVITAGHLRAAGSIVRSRSRARPPGPCAWGSASGAGRTRHAGRRR